MQALALLAEYVDKDDPSIRIGAIMGLGLAYAGAQNEQVKFLCLSFWIWLEKNRLSALSFGPSISLQSSTLFSEL